jgi:hypothetical protein
MSSDPAFTRLNKHTFKHALEHALEHGKTSLDVMIEHASIVNWTKISKIIDIADIYRIGKQLPWDYKVLSKRTDITTELVLQNLSEDWDWEFGLSNNPSITPELVLQTLDRKWNWGMHGLSSNPAITPDMVKQTPDRDWNWGIQGLSNNPSITPSMVLETLNRNWDWTIHGLSSNPAITSDLVLATKKKPWSENIKVWAFISMSLIKKMYSQWVHITYAPGSKKAVEIIKNLELMNRI